MSILAWELLLSLLKLILIHSESKLGRCDPILEAKSRFWAWRVWVCASREDFGSLGVDFELCASNLVGIRKSILSPWKFIYSFQESIFGPYESILHLRVKFVQLGVGSWTCRRVQATASVCPFSPLSGLWSTLCPLVRTDQSANLTPQIAKKS